ncbi:MAG: HAMP domain-containing sensor histidine kinase [Pseudomonadota bacterium]
MADLASQTEGLVSRPGPIAALRTTTIVTQLRVAFLALLLLLGSLGALTISGVEQALEEVRDAERSLQQIEHARAMEAAFNRYLLTEVTRRLAGSGSPEESLAAGRLRGALLAYRAGVAREIEAARTETQRDAERSEMRRAAALSSLFETIESGALFDRALGPDFDAGDAALGFLDAHVGARDAAFEAILKDILADERGEAVEAFTGLDRLRREKVVLWSALASLFLIGAALFTLFFYRRIMRPISAFSDAAAIGPVPAEVPETLPGEFALLARRFNAMVRRVSSEHERLQATVVAKTAALEDANRELRAIDAQRRRFFANVSHELRTPLTTLLGEAQLAERGDEAARLDGLQRILASARFLGRRLDDLMQLARSEDGQLSLTMGDADLGRAVTRAVDAARGYAIASEVDLTLKNAPTGISLALTGDEDSLTQCTLALIDNAVKFTPPGGSVTVSLRADADCVGVEVADTGPGFDGDPTALFDRYAQEASGRTAGGSGLGLAIVRWIAEAHGGSAKASESEGSGAVLTVMLPARQPAKHPAALGQDT